MKTICAAAVASVVLLCGIARAGEATVKMEFKDAPLDTILEQLSASAGLIIVKDTVIDGRFTIISQQPMTVDDALDTLNSVLKEKGFIGIRTEKILKIKRLEDAKKLNIRVQYGEDPDKVKATDEIITQVIPIKYLDAVQLKKDFAPLMPSYADLSANALSNNLIVTDTSANIKRMLQILKGMDTQQATVAEVRVFQLKYASPTAAAKLITDIFSPPTQGNQQGGAGAGRNPFGGGGRFFGGGGGGGGPFGAGGAGAAGANASDETGHRPQKVTASADDRTGSIVVSAEPDTMKVIADILKQLDANPAAEQAVFVYFLANAQAKNLEGVLNLLFATGSGSRSPTTTGNTQRQGVGTSVQRTGSGFGSGSGSSGFGSGSSSSGSSSFGSTGSTFSGSSFNQGASTGGSGRTGGTRTGTTTGSASAMEGLLGQVYVVADYDTNSLMIMTPSKNFDQVKAIVKDLDKPVPQVVIKVLIAEVTHDKTHDVGTDYSILTKGAVQAVMTDFGVASQTTGAVAKIVKGDFTAALRAIETEGKLEVLSRPQIICSNNQASNITVGQEVPFIVSSRQTDTGQTVNTIQYQDIGIILNVTAHINDQGLVIMDVAPEVSSLTGQTVPIQAGVNAPVFAKRSASSRVGVPDGDTVVIGGMMEDKKTESSQGIPVLRKIPGMGWLFGSKTRDKSKTELLIFLTPHVAQAPLSLKPMSEQDTDHLKLLPKAITPGIYDEHMEGLERGTAPIVEIVEPPVIKPPEVKPPESLKQGETTPLPNQGPPSIVIPPRNQGPPPTGK
ncbi:MAG TPA: secretin N-terminal domain-containing protein [Planctomycetota bacterium]|nr:secretin N-terminal domain-containing protein [Planctomycetota bacterium]